MLTEEYLKDNFITAAFIDNEKKNIEILTTSEDKKKVIPTIIPFEEDNHMFKALMTVINIDKLHELTHEKKKEERQLFEDEVLKLAKEDGLIGKELNKEDYFSEIINLITKDQENVDHLFALKLAVFEVEEIRDSQNTELKVSIRKSKTKAEILLNTLKIICKE